MIECPICISPINDNKLIITKCNHSFHNKCIQTWKINYNKDECPLCRNILEICANNKYCNLCYHKYCKRTFRDQRLCITVMGPSRCSSLGYCCKCLGQGVNVWDKV